MRLRITELQRRLEGSELGKILISALIIVALVSILAANLPNSYLKRELTRVADPAIKTTGLVQVWGVFAPDPRRTAVDIEGRVKLASGRVVVWNDPEADPLFGDYWVYRWRKYMEWAIADSYQNVLWRPTAVWLARRALRDGERPVQVTLVRRWTDLYPPGSNPSRGPWRRAPYYRLDVTPEVMRELAS